MKPQLIGFDDGAQPKLVVVTPSIGLIPAKVSRVHAELDLPRETRRTLALGMDPGDAYDSAIREIVLRWPSCPLILTLEDDNLPPADGFWRLLAQLLHHPQYVAVSGLYYSKGMLGSAHIWGDPSLALERDQRSREPVGHTLMECNALSMGFALWRAELFKDKRLRQPWFCTSSATTQDLYFWNDAKFCHGYRCAVDCSIRVGHLDHRGRYGPPDTIY